MVQCGASACHNWLALENQFLRNHETHALHLDALFSLADLGEPVTDRTLVLNVLRSPSDCFSEVGCHLLISRPFPMFLNLHIIKELTMAHRASTLSFALTSTEKNTTGGAPPTCTAPQRSNRSSGALLKSAQKSHHSTQGGKGSQGGGEPPASSCSQPSSIGGSSASNTGTTSGVWPSFQNPWTGAIQMWLSPRAPALSPQ